MRLEEHVGVVPPSELEAAVRAPKRHKLTPLHRELLRTLIRHPGAEYSAIELGRRLPAEISASETSVRKAAKDLVSQFPDSLHYERSKGYWSNMR